ncbi:hypothetical protein DFH06DRAFT_1132132 [Mycena polygramma]|nr:hypothetical protein DFH06DRAFT_1132132 [Mycena polygramma]
MADSKTAKSKDVEGGVVLWGVLLHETPSREPDRRRVSGGETLSDRAIDGFRRAAGEEAARTIKYPRSPPQSATVCEEVSGIDLEVEGAARAIEHRALLIEMQPFASRGSSSYYRVPRSPRRNATVCWIDVEVEGAARTYSEGEPLSHRIATPHLINFVRFHGAFRSFALGRLDYHLS